MVDERYGGENMNIQSIVSAVTMPNSVNRVNSNGSGNRLKNADVELRNAFSIPRNLNNPLEVLRQIAQLLQAPAHQDRYQACFQVAFHGSKIMITPGPNKEKKGNNHLRRPMVGLKRKGAMNFALTFNLGTVVCSG